MSRDRITAYDITSWINTILYAASTVATIAFVFYCIRVMEALK